MSKFEELQNLLSEQTGNKYCPICNTPFNPYHSRQKTCGSEDCKKAFHQEYTKNYAKDPEAKKKHSEATKKWRRKKKIDKIQSENLDKIEEYWQKRAESDEKISENGLKYGELQKQKILENIPKINTEL